MNPEPEDEQAPPEIRGGDRPEDYVTISQAEMEKLRAVGDGKVDEDEGDPE